jgi:hypothetical protein
MMEPKLTNAEVLEQLSNPRFQQRGIGLLITGGSRDERSTTADTVLRQFMEAGRSYLSLTPFEVVAANHFGQREQLVRRDVLLINELGALSQAEEAAIEVIDPIFTVTSTLESILDRRFNNERTTVVTTEYELSELEAQFSSRLADLVGATGVSIRVDGEEDQRGAAALPSSSYRRMAMDRRLTEVKRGEQRPIC